MRRLRHLAKPLLAIPIIVALASPVLADTWAADVDDDVTGVQTTATLTATPGQTITPGVHFILTCNGNNHVDSGASVNIAQQGKALLDGVEVEPTVVGASATTIGPIPADWPVDANGPDNCGTPAPTLSSTTPSTVTIVSPTTLGRHTVSVTFRANTSNSDNQAITGGNKTITYTLNVVPEPPTNLTATATSPTAIELEWDRSPQHATLASYEIHRKAGAGSYGHLASVLPDATAGSKQSHDDTGLVTGTTYCYKVLARYTDANGNFDSAFSDEACETPVAAATYTASFKQPLDSGGIINKAKLGRTIPVKVEVLSGTDEDRDGPVYLGASKTPCETGAPTDPVETYATGGSNDGNAFRWDAAGDFWIHNLDTSKLPGATANACYWVDVYRGGTISDTGVGSGGTQIGRVTIQLFK